MALFIAELAFRGERELLDAAKLGILLASMVAGLLGCIVLRTAGPTGERQASLSEGDDEPNLPLPDVAGAREGQ